MVLGVPLGSVLGADFFILYIYLFHIVGNPIVGYADDTTNYISRPLSRPPRVK